MSRKPTHGQKGAVASFVRPSDNRRIFVFPREGESKEAAIRRVMKHNGAEGQPFTEL